MFESHPLAVADAFIEGGYGGDARTYLEKSLQELAGDDPLAELRKADLHLKIADLDRTGGDHESAIRHYAQALEANPKLLQAQIYLTLSLADAGRVNEALQHVAQLRRSAPDNPNFINLEADVHHAAGDDGRAAEAYRAVLAANARYIPAIVTLASILATSSDAEVRDGAEAVRLAEFLSGAPGARGNPQFATTLADAYAEAGRFDRAHAEAERALRLVLPFGGDAAIQRLQARVELFSSRKPYHVEAN
jgi:tetratricopeptide (TPR) repeat protein